MKPQTADMFPAAEAPRSRSVSKPAAVPPASPSLPPASPVPPLRVPSLLATPLPVPPLPAAPLPAAPMPPPSPVPQGRRAPRLRPLWYAAVFPGLPDGELQRLALHALQFTSFVSLEMPDSLLLEIRGSLKLFGPLADLHARVDACWARLAVPAQSATAPAMLAALWFARAAQFARDVQLTHDARLTRGARPAQPAQPAQPMMLDDPGQLPGRLAPLPLSCTRWDAARLHTLRAMGVVTLGDLLRLPRAGLARRLGPAAVLDLDLALGRRDGPRRAFVPRERFRERCDFESEIDSVAYLEKAALPLIGRCARFLRTRQAGVQAFELKLRHRARPVTRVRLGLASITGERHRLFGVLAQKLTRLELPAPVRGMELISGPLQALSADSLDAFAGLGRGGSRDTAAQLVERLRARLGEQAVYGVSPLPEHRPEAAWQKVRQFQFSGTPRRCVGAPVPDDRPRPLWLLNEPVPLPAAPATLEEGPERIESGWWDGRGVARDYYVAREAQGERLWIFQERHTARWYVHGVFA